MQYTNTNALSKIIKTCLIIFNDLFSSMLKGGISFATEQTKEAINPVLERYPEVFRGFMLELRDLNYHYIYKNAEELDESLVIQALCELIDAMYSKCISLVTNMVVYISDEARRVVFENYEVLKEKGMLEAIPKEFLEFKAGSKVIRVPYGTKFMEIKVPASAEVITPERVGIPLSNLEARLEEVLSNPIGANSLERLVKENQNVTIIIDDHTRATPTQRILPIVLKKIENKTNKIRIIIATGMHRNPTKKEIERKLGEYAKKYEVKVHNARDEENLVGIGKMLCNTELKINKEVASADFVLAIGSIAPHPYAGFSGGAKCILPGVADKNSIISSHLLNIFPSCTIGKIEGNPMAEEIKNAGELAGLNFIINTILDRNGEVVDIVCGHPIKAFEIGVKLSTELYTCEYWGKADIIIITPGGYPKDSTLYLAARALKTSELMLKEKGVIILIAKCQESLYKESEKLLSYDIEDFLRADPQDLISFYILNKYNVFLVSDIEEKYLRRLGIRVFNNFDDAMRNAIIEKGVDPTVLIVPDAYIIPKEVSK